MSAIDDFLDGVEAPATQAASPVSTIDDFLGPVEAPGIIGTLAEGFRSVGRAAGSTFDTVADYGPGVIERAREQTAAPKAEPLEAFYAEIAKRKTAAGEDPGLLDAIGVVGGAVLRNPKGAGYAVLEQAPNALAALAPAFAGMKGGAAIGSVGGPVGSAVGGVVGGIAGLFAGNATLEIGHKAMESARDGDFTAEDRTAALSEGATKAGVITAVDAATLGASKWITGASLRAVERATTRALTDAGIDVTNEVAVLAARRQPEIVEAVRRAQDVAAKTTATFGQRAARAGGALALETVGEGLGEYLGELAATGQADTVDAVLESVLSLGQSGAEVAWGASKNAARIAQLQLDPNKGPISRAALAAVEQEGTGALPAPPQGAQLAGSLGRPPQTPTEQPIDQRPDQDAPADIDAFLGTAPAIDQRINQQRDQETPADIDAFLGTPHTVDQQQDVVRLLPLKTFAAASKRAETETKRTGSAQVVIAHPTAPDRFAVVPSNSPLASAAPSLDVDGLFAVQTPVPLKNAKKLAGLLSANGNQHAVVPSPSGRGFGVAPLEQLSPTQRQSWAGFQPGAVRGAARIAPGPVAAPPVQPVSTNPSNPPSAPATPIGTPGAVGQLDGEVGAVLPQQPESAQGFEDQAERADPNAVPATPPGSAPSFDTEATRAAPDLQPMDHGELNIPGRTDNIDAELDRWKADQAKAKQAQAKIDTATRRAQKAEAKRLFTQIGPAMIERFAARFGRKEIEHTLDSMVKWEPAKFIDLAQRFEREQVAAQSNPSPSQPLPVNFEVVRADGSVFGKYTEQRDAQGPLDRAGKGATVRAVEVSPPQKQAQNDTTPATPEADPYDNIETRPGTTAAQRTRGRGAIAALVARIDSWAVRHGRGSVTLLGSGLYESFTATGGASLVGQTVRGSADLAALAQVHRDPRFETLRVFFTSGNKIVGQTAYSSRLPAAVVLPNNLADHIQRDKTAFGADGYFILHNHPSGKALPSVPDLQLTKAMASQVTGFRSHVVIDHNEFATINSRGLATVVPAPELAGVDFHSNPELKHQLLGLEIRGASTLATIGKALQIEGGHASVIFTRRQGQVQLLVDLPAALLEDKSKLGVARLMAVIRRMARAAGAGGHRFIVLPEQANLQTMKHLLAKGVFTDIVTADGASLRDTGARAGGDFLDKNPKTAPRAVEEQSSGYAGGTDRNSNDGAFDPANANITREAPATYSAEVTTATGETTIPLALLNDRSKFGKAKVRLALRRLQRNAGKVGTLTLPEGASVAGVQWLVAEGLVGDVVRASGRLTVQESRESGAAFSPARATVRDWITHQFKQDRGWAMGALTRDQIADLYGRDIPQVDRFDRVVQAMDLTRNRMTEQADALVERWRKLADADQLADVMHSATLAQFDPDQHTAGTPEQTAIAEAFDRLSMPAQELYRDVRDQYRDTLVKIRDALAARVERSGATGTAIAADIRLRFDKYLQEGPYFSLARFGDFLLIADRGDERTVEAFESSFQRERRAQALRAQGFTVKLTARQEYSATKDGAAGSFIGDVLEKIDGLQIDPAQKSALMNNLNQLAISTLPDGSFRKHFAHRKGTPGFSNDAMRAFASSQMHAAHHLARIRHADELAILIDEMRQEIRSARGNVDTTGQQQVVNELTRRLDLMLNPNTHPVTAALGQVGFIMSLGGSIASGLVNLTQTPLVTFPWLGAKFGFDAASGALLKASKDYFGGKWNRWSGFVLADNPNLADEERRALRHLEEAGLINLTQAADLAGTANTDSTVSKRAFVMNRAMKIVGWTFHTPEVFNRQVSALAAYRLARDAGQNDTDAIESARQALIRTHFDYSSSNRARFMSGNVMRVLTMFKQYSQQMTYLLWRNAYLALKGESADVKREARRMLVGVASMHFAAAGSLGLPLGIFGISPLLTLLSMGMGEEDEPFDWQTEYRNALHDVFGKEGGEAIAKGPLRLLLNVDLASRVGLGDLWIRPPQKDAEGRDLVEAWLITLLGPVAGYAGQMGTAMQAFEEGKFARGVEAMMPKFIASPLKAIRYETDGVRSWRGTDLGITLTEADIVGTALGFQPARLAEMYEGRSAVKGREAALQRHREDLMRAWREARDAGDTAGLQDVINNIRAFNTRNRAFGIGPQHLRAHWQAHRRAQLQTTAGIHLSRRRDELRDVGRFANLD